MPIITIFGATGTQGSSVVDAVLVDGRYTPRAVSRSLDSPASKALLSKGVEVVKADLFDLESVKAAIRGSEAVFGNTTFFDTGVLTADATGKDEITQGKNLVDAAKAVGVDFFIWSSLPSAAKASNGLYTHVHHLENKVEIEDHLRASGVPYAVVLTGWFVENVWKLGSLQKTATGYTIPIPNYGPNGVLRATWIAHDLGASVVALLSNYKDTTKNILGQSFPVVSMKFTFPQFAAAIAAAIKQEVTFTQLETSGVPELDEMVCVSIFGEVRDLHRDAVPNPALISLGVKFGSMEEFIQSEVVPRFF
ncbi:hypothetical protein FB451DRAFT_1403553 [Mycena latifolia]|nr:hypothetical protein FB451DRAFT_1403553 [Mycena latifolia]